MDSALSLLKESWHIALAGPVLAVLAWLVLGRGPRRLRAYRRGQRRLKRGEWAEGLAQAEKLRGIGTLPPVWQGRADRLAGDCHRQASGGYLTDKKYEESLDHLLQASRLLQLKEDDAVEYVRGAMLAETRRLFATAQVGEAQALLERVQRLGTPSAEAAFWQALCFLREGQSDRARGTLEAIKDGSSIEPPFYLGMLHLRAGQATEGLRWLSAAHRIDPQCPFVNWQLGQAMIAAGSDPSLALRALQRALGPHGLTPERGWAEGMPGPEKSFIRRLTAQHAFVCPLLGNDVRAWLRQARLTLAQAHDRLGQHAEAAQLCQKLLGESAPTLPVLRTLGLALGRLEQYDEAFKHLRAAHDLEETKQPLTAGYLALCGAMGKPVQAEDKISNVVWAIGLLRQFTPDADREWARIHGRVLGEARAAGLVPALEDVRRAAQALAAVEAANPDAAGVYDDLAVHDQAAVESKHAWLYARAVQEHGVRGRHDLDLLAQTFRQAAEARQFFLEHGWDLDEVECIYLIRWADAHPASFPAELGDDAAVRARRLLLDRSQRLEEAGNLDEALATGAALVRLLPTDAKALDRLACLHFRRGNADLAVAVLANWQARHPTDHRPYLRLAVLEQQRGNRLARTLALQHALDRAKGKERAAAAWLGARLALVDWVKSEGGGSESSGGSRPRLATSYEAFRLLQECLRDQPDHQEALACQAGLRWLAGDRQGLAEQSAAMRQPEGDPAFHYLAAVSHLIAREYEPALAAARLAVGEPALVQESRLVMAWSHLGLGDADGAIPHLKMVATDEDCLSVESAQALLGRVRFQAGDYEDAVQWWQQIPQSRRAGWQLEPAFLASVFLSGLTAYRQGRFEEAVLRFRDSGRLGFRDRRIGPLMQLGLFKAGQQLLFPPGENHELDHVPEKAAGLLEKCLQVGCKDPQAAYLLAQAYQRQGRVREAREALSKIAAPDAGVFLQRGLLALQEKQLAVAEEEFARARQLDPAGFSAGYNLLMTRLSLGKLEAAGEVLPSLLDQAPESDRGLFQHLKALLTNGSSGELAALDRAQEEKLISLLRKLGNLEPVGRLIQELRQVRPDSPPVREAQFEVSLLAARQELHRCNWIQAEQQLASWGRQWDVVRTPVTTLHNLRGCAACLGQDFAAGIQHFNAAIKLDDSDPCLHQNRALALELSGDSHRAEQAWMRYIEEIQESKSSPAELPHYGRRLAIDALLRLAGTYSDRLNYAAALPLVERAHRLQPENPNVLDRLFQLYRQLERTDLARRALQRLHQLLPGDPNLELYELELSPLRRSEELENWINALERIMQRYPRERRVQERATVLLGTFVNLVKDLTRQGNDQFSRATRQVRALRQDEINWRAVHKVMRDLRQEFTVLRHAVGRALVIDSHPGHLAQIRDLVDSLDRKIEETRRWQGQGV